ncbi:HesA/MoeB/ThiF family protein [Streptomyces sp. NPDC004134]|uniref:HesA/MoeB/ThiF family protein n=1 Tax=Streptomyces sp. NPDC004134 TaxID=3364691 RepID=UPI0036C20012
MAVGEWARPRVKPEHRGYRTVAGNVRIGSVVYGVGAEIEDPRGWVWTLVEAADGTRSAQDIVTAVRARHEEVEPGDVTAALERLAAAGFLEDAAAPLPAQFSPREAERYSRGVPLLRWMDLGARASAWEAQLRLKEARVLVLGVGGTGGAAAWHLAASGVGHLHVVDDDRVELSNLNRQLLYAEADVGRRKAEAAVARLAGLNPDIRVTGEVRRVATAAELAALVVSSPPYDVFVLGADGPPQIRRWANRACLAAGLPWVDGGYSGPLVTAGIHRPGTGGCWECLHDQAIRRADLGLAQGAEEPGASAHLPWNPANAVTAGLSGALVAYGALALLTGIPPLEPGVRFGFNLMVPGDEVTVRLPRRPDCPACGSPG